MRYGSLKDCIPAVAIVTALLTAGPEAAGQTLTRNALSADQNTLGNLSGWSTSTTASGITPTSVTASNTLEFSNWWTPGKLSSGRLWLDAADIGSLTLASGSVTSWGNKASTGSSANATVVSPFTAPSYVTSGNTSINGLPAVVFNGTSNMLTSNATVGGSSMTTYAVTLLTGTNPARYGNYEFSPHRGWLTTFSASGTAGLDGRPAGGGNYGQTLVGGLNVQIPLIHGGVVTGGQNLVAYANGVSGTAPSPVGGDAGNISNNLLRIGGIAVNNGLYGNQATGEFVMTSSNSASERQLIEGYLAWKWGTQSQLPNDHPYKNSAPMSPSETVFLGGNQSAAGLVFSGAGSATTLVGGTSGGAAANSMTLGAGGLTVSAAAGATTLGQASGATVSLVLGDSQAWTNNSGSLLQAHNGIARSDDDTISRVLTVSGSGNTQLDGVIADGGLSGSLELFKSGAGTLTLSGSNTYSGATTISGGTLALASQAAFGSSSGISIATGAMLDVSEGGGGFTLGNNRSLGGDGSILGNVTFDSGSKLVFSETDTLAMASGTASFFSGAPGSRFGIDDLLGISSSTPLGTYTLISGTVDTTNLDNLGSGNAYILGDGKSAYFQSGSLQVLVVPEPATLPLAGLGIAAAAWAVRRRRFEARSAS